MLPAEIELFVDRLCGVFPTAKVAPTNIKKTWRTCELMIEATSEQGKQVLKQLEEEGDVLYARSVGALFEHEEPAIEVLKWKEIFDALEEAIDECEDVSNVLESIALKNS